MNNILHTIHVWSKRHRDIFSVVGIVFVWRLVVEFFGQYANYRWSLLRVGSGGAIGFRLQRMKEIWDQWDAGWYYDIIQHGYQFVSTELHSNITFFPLYPYLVKFTSWVLHVDPLHFGPIFSTLCLFAAAVIFYKLILLDYTKELALASLVALLIFPLSIFFVAMYAESLFLLLAVAVFYAARKGNFWVAGVLAFFLSLTRLVGAFAFVALVFEYLQQKNFKWKHVRADIVATLLSPLGLGTYMAYIWAKFGSPWLVITASEASNRSFQPIWHVIATQYAPLLIDFSKASLSDDLRVRLFDLLFFLLGVLLVVLCFMYLRKSYAIFALLAFLAPAVSGQLGGIGRYEIVIFPFFILFGLAFKWLPFKVAYVFLSGFLLFEFLILFVTGNWVA